MAEKFLPEVLMFVLFSAMKNEGPFVLEWLAYHRAIGFERVVIVANPSTDGMNELLAALHEAGEVEYYPSILREGVAAQRNAAVIANEGKFFRNGDWVTWIDADEFMNIHLGEGRLTDLVSFAGDAEGILIPWRCFGDSGHQTFPGRFISDDFTWASTDTLEENREVKSFFKVSPRVPELSLHNVNRPRIDRKFVSEEAYFINSAGKKIIYNERQLKKWTEGKDFFRSARLAPKDFSWRAVQLNHYAVRTPEFFRLKGVRGRAHRAGEAGATNTRYTPAFYALMNQNMQEDRSILRHKQVTDRELARLMSIPTIAKAHALVQQRHQNYMAELRTAECAQE